MEHLHGSFSEQINININITPVHYRDLFHDVSWTNIPQVPKSWVAVSVVLVSASSQRGGEQHRRPLSPSDSMHFLISDNIKHVFKLVLSTTLSIKSVAVFKGIRPSTKRVELLPNISSLCWCSDHSWARRKVAGCPFLRGCSWAQWVLRLLYAAALWSSYC